MQPNETATTLPAETLAALQTGRAELACLFDKAHKLDAQVSALRGAGVATDNLDLNLAEAIIAIREKSNALVSLIEEIAGEDWTPGLRLKHFVNELRSARSALAAQDVIFGRLNFAVEQIEAGAANEALPEESHA